MLTYPNLGEFFASMRYLLLNSPIYDFLYLWFACLLVFALNKRLSHGSK